MAERETEEADFRRWLSDFVACLDDDFPAPYGLHEKLGAERAGQVVSRGWVIGVHFHNYALTSNGELWEATRNWIRRPIRRDRWVWTLKGPAENIRGHMRDIKAVLERAAVCPE